MEQQHKFPKILWLACAVAALGGFLFGFDMAVVSGILPLVTKQFSLSALQQGWFVSSALVGCIVGVAMSGELGDRYGRRRVLILAAVLFLVSALGCGLLPTFSSIIVARILGGVGVGIASSMVPLYISEIAPARIRGRLVTYYQLAVTFGILVAYLSNAFLVQGAPSMVGRLSGWGGLWLHEEVWRGMFIVGTLPALVFLLGLLGIPESPRWLLQKGQTAAGMALLNRFVGEAEAAADLKSRGQGQRLAAYRDLFSPRLRKALLLGLLLPFFSQFCGINAIIYYGPSILNTTGVSLSGSLQSQIVFGVANLVFTLIAVWKVDKLGRRPLYLIGTAAAALSLMVVGGCLYGENTPGMLLLFSVIIFLASFAFSIGPLKFVVAAEIFPSNIRGRAMALSIMVMWVADTVIGQLTPLLLDRIGAAVTFWFFALWCILAFITVYRLLPETKGRSLADIERQWSEK
ncbi:sugar porter family MFS transporter [Parapedobacter sp. ISTM3]|uniref:MFS transporter, SP family, arabinose:H+ symporter n=1 Tax=Parapedobacter luteus TaxID=623280 RepID=A0A1T5BU96_9SPHI|nr:MULTISPECIES: sugar porter family MFS transporter [Parapedobacter]MBK1439982.1 sugar porter family MFS transporter [Parapedobacter sp. ISTM3]SKB50533.1 MFS transporter, SP family, arabinose:H+ symporter [Parapedobacter luteus]